MRVRIETPEDPRDIPRMPPRRRELPPLPAGLAAIAGAIVAIELVLSLADAGILGRPDWREHAVILFGLKLSVYAGIWEEAWPFERLTMLVTHAFLHGGLVHMAMNVVVILGLGKVANGLVGPARATLLFFLAAAAGGVAFVLLGPRGGEAVGASGAVFGYLGLWQSAEFRMRMRRGLPLRPIWGMLAGLVLANAAMYLMLAGLLAWEAHLGGFLAGWVLGWLWRDVTFRDGVRPGFRPD